MTSRAQELESTLQERLGAKVFGVESVIHGLSIALVSRGHVLLQGAPGLGKTLIGKTLAKHLGGTFKRIQGTPDLMPSDIIGVHVYNSKNEDFDFRPGPLFADVVLVDEINRTGPKTQSALLEAMEERQVSVDRTEFHLGENFMLIATQNPHEFEGTYPLPESQLDRFLMRINLDYPSRADESRVLTTYDKPDHQQMTQAGVSDPVPPSLIEAARDEVAEVHVSEKIVSYALDIAQASREHHQISLGLSTRGVLALMRCARIEAAMRGGEFVTPDDIKAVAPWAGAHRIVLTPDAALEGLSDLQLIENLLAQVAAPR